ARNRLWTGSGTIRGLQRPESLAEAYAGLDRLLIIPTLEPGKRAAQNVAAIDAAVRAGVKHIVFMSTAGARQEEEPALSASYWRGEQHRPRRRAPVRCGARRPHRRNHWPDDRVPCH